VAKATAALQTRPGGLTGGAGTGACVVENICPPVRPVR
jgi:hypothetical protein